MADIVESKEVFFIGAWRTTNVTDQLLLQISKQMHHKEGYSTKLDLQPDGLYLTINNINGQSTKPDKIPLETIADFIDNKFNNTCILAIVKDKAYYSVFVFVCRCEEDSAAMVQGFQALKKKLSGEGYNLDMKQSGVNWTLKNKDVIQNHPNGEATVYVTNTRNDAHDSVSHTSLSSDVREEINDLAKEVRDIRLMMQKSRGRHHFAKHYGYLNSPPPVQTVTDRKVVAEEVFVAPEQINRNYSVVKRNYIKREPQPNVVVVRGQGGQYKTKISTPGHYLRSTSQSSLMGSVRRRVYPSPTPALEARYASSNSGSIRVIGPNQRLVKREVRGSTSDVVPKSIEHVYRSKKYKRIIPISPVSPVLPVQTTHTYDYVASQHAQPTVTEEEIAPVRSVFIDEAPPKVIPRSATHIRYETNGGDLYENSAIHDNRRDLSNVSTLVNVSSNDIADETLQVERTTTESYQTVPHHSEQVIVVRSDGDEIRQEYDQQVRTSPYSAVHQSGGQTIVVQGNQDVVRDSSYTQNDNVIYIKSDATIVNQEPEKTFGGEVYHVKAKGLEHFEAGYYQAPDDDRNIVIIDRDDYVRSEIPVSTTATSTIVRNDVQVINASNLVNEENNEGLWGEYAKEPEPYDPDVDIVKETAYRYSHDENGLDGVKDDVTEDVSNELVTTSETVTQKRVRYLDEVETAEGEVNEKVNDVVDEANDSEVRDIIDKVREDDDDENNNVDSTRVRFDDGVDGTDFHTNKGSVMSELRQKFTEESETKVLF